MIDSLISTNLFLVKLSCHVCTAGIKFLIEIKIIKTFQSIKMKILRTYIKFPIKRFNAIKLIAITPK